MHISVVAERVLYSALKKPRGVNYKCTTEFGAVSYLVPRKNSTARILDNYTRTCKFRFSRRKSKHGNVWGMLHLGTDGEAGAKG